MGPRLQGKGRPLAGPARGAGNCAPEHAPSLVRGAGNCAASHDASATEHAPAPVKGPGNCAPEHAPSPVRGAGNCAAGTDRPAPHVLPAVALRTAAPQRSGSGPAAQGRLRPRRG
ncbi:hypothetical protein GCM10010372_65060 [Streptomyces tauricus]|nr:hypothetical protein GCM10010372_65060 [Streptomyces tauricus]